MPRNKLPDSLRKIRINVSLDPANKTHLDRKVTKAKAHSVSSAINDLITQDRNKK
jgi:hypothetical protein